MPGKRALFAPLAGGPAAGPAPRALGSIEPIETCDAKEIALSASDPNYDPATDVYRQIYRGHDNASAVTNNEGLTVYFDPDTNEVLGFAITKFSDYYKAHATEDGEFEVSIPPSGCRPTSRRRWTSTRTPSSRASGSRSSTRPRPPAGSDHDRVGALALGDHREDLGRRVDVDVNQRRPVGGERLGEGVVEL